MEVITGWTHRSFPVTDTSCVGEARRHCAHTIADWGWSDVEAGQLSLIVTELGSNLMRHAVGGQLWIAFNPAWQEVEVIALDRGPGMPDVQSSLTDGVSTGSGSPGTGLGAVRRMASDFDVHSSPAGTLVLARMRPGGVARPPIGARLGAVCLPAPGETHCGDGWALAEQEGEVALLVSDGLGHGPEAAAASRAALAAFANAPFTPLPGLMALVHQAMQGTRGGAVFAAHVPVDAVLRYSGAGNILGRVFSGVFDQGLITPHGTAGVQMRRTEASTHALPRHALVLLHTDGVASRWPSAPLVALLPRNPTLLAAALAWTHTRGRDDTTVVVLKQEEPA